MAGEYKVIILGGGFGGLHAAKALRRASVAITLIDRHNYHLFQPLMYQVATGSLSAGDIAAPLRGVLSRQKNTRVSLGEAVDIDPVARQLTLVDGSGFQYDSLIVATGSQNSYYGNDGWRQWAPSLKTVEEALNVRHKILYAFEAAERVSDPKVRHAWLTFVIVGAGATGLELAGALAETSRETLRHDFRSIRPEEARIVLMDGSPRVLPGYPEDLSAKAERLVTKLGVEVRKGVRVAGVNREGVTLQDGSTTERLAARTVLWAGGIVASDFGKKLAGRTGAETDKSGWIRVNPDLKIPGFRNIYVVGDLALAFRTDRRQLPGVAQVAMQEGAYAAKAIIKRLDGANELPRFRYFDKGDMAVIGRAAAVANIFGLHLSGYLGFVSQKCNWRLTGFSSNKLRTAYLSRVLCGAPLVHVLLRAFRHPPKGWPVPVTGRRAKRRQRLRPF
ncbi:MAG: NAD(P)/FAD-dependent oxidoreductase [Terriglobia bacterium]